MKIYKIKSEADYCLVIANEMSEAFTIATRDFFGEDRDLLTAGVSITELLESDLHHHFAEVSLYDVINGINEPCVLSWID